MIDVALLSVIRRRHLRDGMSIREVARRTGLSRITVRKYLANGVVEPNYSRRKTATKIDAFVSRVNYFVRFRDNYDGRLSGQVLDAAVLIACGVDARGHRDVLGCSVSLSEAEVHWWAFLSELKDRGLYGIEFVVSDAHEGLQAALQAVFPSVPWQCC